MLTISDLNVNSELWVVTYRPTVHSVEARGKQLMHKPTLVADVQNLKNPLLHTFKIFKAKQLKKRQETTWPLLASSPDK
jgi:outer membrane protein assembly factor BamA